MEIALELQDLDITDSLAGAALQPEISFVLPCLNESATIKDCIEQIHDTIDQLNTSAEIIVADNGSNDASPEIAWNMGARIVDAPIRGYGAALIFGCRAAKGNYIVIGDADGSYDFRQAIPMIQHLRQGFDLVIGTRFKGKIKPGAMPWLNRYLGNPVLTGILNLFYQSNLSDAHCGLRAFRRELFEHLDLQCTGMEFASEMIVKASLQGMRLTEVPITYFPDGRDRQPHLNPWRDGWRHLRFLLLYNPMWVYIWPGSFLLLFAISLNTALAYVGEGGFRLFNYLFIGPHWTIPATLAAVLGMQMLWLGVFTNVYSYQKGLSVHPKIDSWVTRLFTSEKLFVAGVVFVILGGLIEFNILLRWISTTFGELHSFSLGMYGLMWIMLGTQILTNGFFMSLLTQGIHTLKETELTNNRRHGR